MIDFLVDAAGLADGVHLDLLEERVGDTPHHLEATTLLLQNVRRLLQAEDPWPEEQ